MTTYCPHGAMVDVWKCRDRECLVDGVAGSGKTRGILEYVVLAMSKYPRARALLTRQTRASMSQSVLVTLEQQVLIGDDDRPLHWVNAQQRETRRSYNLPNGSEIVVGGLDRPEKILSTEYDIIAGFEWTETTLHAHETLLTRLRNGRMQGRHRMIVDTNPAGPSHWLIGRANAGKMKRIPSRHTDNPRFWRDGAWTDEGKAYLETLGALSGHRRARLLEGHWAAAEGLVYPEFDAAVHVLEAMPDGWEAWDKYRSFDFGFNDPFICQWWAKGPDGALYLYREVYQSQRTVAQHATLVNELSSGESYEYSVADHDLEDRHTLAECGIDTVAAYKDIARGIDAVRNRLMHGTGRKPRLFVLRGACVSFDADLESKKRPTSSLAEWEGYVWKQQRGSLVSKDEPVDADNHGMDAARYIVAQHDCQPNQDVGVAWSA